MSNDEAQQLYDDYVKEREQLVKYEQQAYDNFQKTILTLSSAFLAFSVSFLGLLKRDGGAQPPPPLNSLPLLVSSWISFASSVILMLVDFVIDAKALRTAVADIEPLAEGKAQKSNASKWNRRGYVVLGVAGAAFTLGIIMLLVFCARNVTLF